MAKLTSEELLRLGKETNEMDFAVENKSELLPCPFCGSKAEIIINKSSQVQTSNVRCTLCGCRKTLLRPPFYNGNIEEDAIKSWNTRTPKERSNNE